jgi:hypothetical protein
MGEIDKLPPAYQVPPARPATGGGSGNQAPQRKPATGDRQQQERRRRKPHQDDSTHVDEYA